MHGLSVLRPFLTGQSHLQHLSSSWECQPPLNSCHLSLKKPRQRQTFWPWPSNGASNNPPRVGFLWGSIPLNMPFSPSAPHCSGPLERLVDYFCFDRNQPHRKPAAVVLDQQGLSDWSNLSPVLTLSCYIWRFSGGRGASNSATREVSLVLVEKKKGSIPKTFIFQSYEGFFFF